jgi:sulfur carrier protein ThiS
MEGKITVRLAQVQDLQTIHISAKTLGELLKSKEIEYNSSVRVNGEVKSKEYRLRNNDIITIVDAVSGGR